MKHFLLIVLSAFFLIGTSFTVRAAESEPFLAYAKGSLDSSQISVNADLLKNNTLAEGHAWFISPVDNYAPIAIVNSGDSDIEITKVEFSEGFGFSSKVEISIPARVEYDRALFLSPSLTATTPGFYSGEMKVYVEGSDEPLIAKLEGAIKPEYETKTIFHNEEAYTVRQMREGWLATGGWEIDVTSKDYQQVYPGKYWWFQAAIMKGNTEENAILCSPLISYKKGAEVWFDATCYQPEGAIEVLYSKDRSNWTLLKTLTVPPTQPDENKPLTEDMFNGFFSSMGQGYENLFKTFKVTVPEEGNGCIAFRTSSYRASVDNVVMDGSTVDFDVAYISHSIESEFPLNTVKDFSVTFRNLRNEIFAEEYQLQIVRDGNVLKTVAGTKPLPKGSDVPITLECAFSSLGEHTLSVNLICGENIVRSETANIKVVDEGYHEIFQVGASHINNRFEDGNNTNFLNPVEEYVLKSEALYPPSTLQYINSYGASANNGVYYNDGDKLTGLRKGDKITSLQWTGYHSNISGTYKKCEIPVKLYLQNTPDSLYTDNKFTDVDKLTLVGTIAYYDLTQLGSDRSFSHFKEGIVKIVFDEPFIYAGESLRVVLELPKIYTDPENPEEAAILFQAGTIWSRTSFGNINSVASDHFLSIYQKNSTETERNYSVPILLMAKETRAKFLSGIVKNSVTEKGIEGVTITASSEEGVSFSGVTDAEGKYEIVVGNPAFDFTITASHGSFHSYTSANNEDVKTVNLAKDNVEHSFTMVEKNVAISGSVVDCNGTPVAQATVTLTNPEEVTYSIEVKTHDQGNFILTTNQLNSNLTITVKKDGYATATHKVEVGDVEDGNTRESIALQNAIVIYEYVSISGVVKDEDGNFIKDATVILKDADNNSSDYTTEEDGAFSFPENDIDKEYTLTVTAEGYDDNTQNVKVEKDNVTGLTVTLTKSTSGIDSITADGLSVTPGYGKIEISAHGVDVVVADITGRVLASYKRLDGTVVVDGLSSGIYIVNNVKIVVR